MKKEENLIKQVEILKTKLEEVEKETSLINNNDSSENILEVAIDKIQDTSIEESNLNTNYDIILEVPPQKISEIKSQIIDGQKYLVIPIHENEQAKVNGLDNLI